MIKVNVKDKKGKIIEDAVLPNTLFDIKTNISLIHQVITAELSAKRQGTKKVKTRAEVRGGGKKPYKQKGTGNARQGSIRAPQYAGGGIVHGPTPLRNYSKRIPKKMIKNAIYGALSNRIRTDNFHIILDLKLEKPSTKEFLNIIKANNFSNKILFISSEQYDYLSARNINGIKIIKPNQINAYDIVSNNTILWTKNAINEFVSEEIKYTAIAKSEKASKETDNSNKKSTNTNKAVNKNNKSLIKTKKSSKSINKIEKKPNAKTKGGKK